MAQEVPAVNHRVASYGNVRTREGTVRHARRGELAAAFDMYASGGFYVDLISFSSQFDRNSRDYKFTSNVDTVYGTLYVSNKEG